MKSLAVVNQSLMIVVVKLKNKSDVFYIRRL